ncbi:MAG: shikimate dehydrogenase family protein [Kiritimatiellia bacterium]
MATRKFAVIGHPVAHSLSPKMHAANFAAIGFDGTYEKFDVAPADVAAFVRAKRDEGYAGLNVTVPHKLAVIPLLDHVDESVARYGACNTIRFEPDGTLTGFNTDVIGFVAGLAAHGRTLAGRKVFIVGCGGAGSALATACCYEGAAELTVADLDAPRTAALAEKLTALATGTKVVALLPVPAPAPDAGVCGADLAASKERWGAAAETADIVVNATPMGLHEGEPSALPPQAFHPGQFVLDIVPTVRFPPTAAAAKAAGADACDGLEFLVGQGAKSFELWTGVAADRAAMLAAIRGRDGAGPQNGAPDPRKADAGN